MYRAMVGGALIDARLLGDVRFLNLSGFEERTRSCLLAYLFAVLV